MDGGCVASCETVVSCLDLTGFELRLKWSSRKVPLLPARLPELLESAAEELSPAFGDTKSTSPGSRDVWGPGVVAERKREPTAEASPCRRPPWRELHPSST